MYLEGLALAGVPQTWQLMAPARVVSMPGGAACLRAPVLGNYATFNGILRS